MTTNRISRGLAAVLVASLALVPSARLTAQAPPAADTTSSTNAPAPKPIEFVQETLGNGLRVIYAPLKTAPVVNVRVHYHVGSRDERPDRQGFAHMFEHMMFRGSAHLADGQHGELVNGVGGLCNAYT